MTQVSGGGSNPSFCSGVQQDWPRPGTNTDFGLDLSRPVEQVNWYDSQNYCGQLTQRERAAGRIAANSVYRLPTEAEWEYACRAWTSTRFSHGDDPGYVAGDGVIVGYTNLTNYAWYWDNSGGTTHSVGQKLANPWGLYDMHGNVWEWCQSWYGEYPGGIAIDPQGPATGSERVLRGGSWYYWFSMSLHAPGCRSAARGWFCYPNFRGNFVGFRVLLAPGQP